MELTVKERKESKIAGRTEVKAELSYSGKTPSREELKAHMVQKLGATAEHLVIVKIAPVFGRTMSIVTAHIYHTKEAMAIEPKHIFTKGQKKEKGAKAAEK